LTPICTTSFVVWGFAPNPSGEAYSYSVPPDSLAVFRGPTSKGMGGREGQERERRDEEREGERRERGGEGREEVGPFPREQKEKSSPMGDL